jgi:ribosomal protein S18 acetylase RimI-like enzyme
MRVEKTNSINFGARLIDQVSIAKKLKDCSIGKPNISCVEIDSKNTEDINALYQVTKDWQDDIFSINIYNNLIGKYNGSSFYKEYKTFAITNQDNPPNVLDSKKIIALAEIKELIPHSVAHITHIQVNPEYYDKGIGTSMLDILKQMYSHITLTSTSNHKAKEFYRKNDFIESPAHSSKFSWTRDIFSMLGIGKKE